MFFTSQNELDQLTPLKASRHETTLLGKRTFENERNVDLVTIHLVAMRSSSEFRLSAFSSSCSRWITQNVSWTLFATVLKSHKEQAIIIVPMFRCTHYTVSAYSSGANDQNNQTFVTLQTHLIPPKAPPREDIDLFHVKNLFTDKEELFKAVRLALQSIYKGDAVQPYDGGFFTWTEANKKCLSEGGTLPILQDREDLDLLINVVGKPYFVLPIGLQLKEVSSTMASFSPTKLLVIHWKVKPHLV